MTFDSSMIPALHAWAIEFESTSVFRSGFKSVAFSRLVLFAWCQSSRMPPTPVPTTHQQRYRNIIHELTQVLWEEHGWLIDLFAKQGILNADQTAAPSVAGGPSE